MFFEIVVRFSDRKSVQVDGAYLLDIDSAVGRDLLADSILARPPDIDYHFVTGAKAVIQGGGDIDTGFEGQITGVEDVTSEDLITACEVLGTRVVLQHIRGVLLHLFTKAGFVDIRTCGVGSVHVVLLLIELLHTQGLLLGYTPAG